MDKIEKRISEGESLLIQSQSLRNNEKPLPGSFKLANRIKSELRFLSKVLSGKIPLKPCHITSTNLSSLEALLRVVKTIEVETVTEVLPVFKDDSENSICVDIVARNGHFWIKVIARNVNALYSSWKGRCQFGERNLMDVAKDYLRTAQSNPVDFQVPKVVFYFTNGVPIGLAKDLGELGLLVDGDIKSQMIEDVSDDEEEDSYDLSDSLSKIKLEKLLNVENSHSSITFPLKPEVVRANLDVSTMLTLVSNLSNGFDKFSYGVPVLDEQAKRERVEKVLPKLEKFLENKILLACQDAVANFEKIIKTIGGEKEKQRAKTLMCKLTVVSNNPSKRTLSLITSSKLNKRAKTVFGTGDSERAITVTANIGFVRAAAQNGVRYSVFEHEPRALTEKKESSCSR